jgi:hypothetical protein
MGVSILFLGVMVVIAGVSMFLPARNARKNDQIREAWPTSQGTVTSSEIVAQPPMEGKTGKEILQYDVSVKYQFRSGGQLHFGSTVSYPRHLYTKSEADKVAARYPEGAAVAVRHNPEDTRECYLEIEKTEKGYGTSIVLMVIGGILTLSGLFFGLG